MAKLTDFLAATFPGNPAKADNRRAVTR